MLKSMTACGRGMIEENGAHFVVEIQAVNRKHLDIQVHLPRTLSFLEADIRSRVAKEILRGQVSIRISASFYETPPYKVIPNLALAEEMKKAWDEVGERLGTKGFSLEFLLDSPEILSVEFSISEEKKVWHVLEKALNEATSQLILMKVKEGHSLFQDFSKRLELVESLVKLIEIKSVDAPLKWRKKVTERLQELGQGLEADERLLREVALLAEKGDITEECVRFHSHVRQYRDYMEKEGAFGKTLEFILQELGREINTIGSKSQDVEISRHVIEVKSELERMREQVQNVE